MTRRSKHRGEAYLLEAGPGTGKTQTLTARVEGLLEEGLDPRRVLLLTFSNKAAGEMAERIARKRKDAAAAMWIGTFHAFGLDLLRRFHAELGLPRDPQMLDRTEAVELLEHEFPRLGLRHYRNVYDPTQIIADMLAAVSRAKDEVVDPAEYARLAEAMGLGEAAERAAEVARVYAAYEKLKREAHQVDFGDLVSLPVQLLERDAAIRAHLQAQYDHVFFYAPAEKSNGHNRPVSPFLARLGVTLTRGTVVPSRTLAEPEEDEGVFLDVRGGEDRLIELGELIDLSAPGIERFITAPKGATTYEIRVNSRRRTVDDRRVTFEQVVQLAFPGQHAPNVEFSMTYRHAASKPHAGELGAGGSVEVKKKGTIFNVTRTVQS